jgi:hypothetical protein
MLFRKKSAYKRKPVAAHLSGEEYTGFVNRLIDTLFVKYNIPLQGENFYQQGQSCTSEADCDGYIRDYIEPLFNNLDEEFNHTVEQAKDVLKARLEEEKRKDLAAAHELDESHAEGFLSGINTKLNHHKLIDDDIENIVFPEKGLKETIKNAFADVDQKIADLAGPGRAGADLLSETLERREMFFAARDKLRYFRKLLDEFNSIRHSRYYPPKIGYIRLFYTLCGIFCVAEIGFSMTIFGDIIVNDLPPGMNTALSVLYSTAASAGLAILFKNLIDALLFKNPWRAVAFWLICGLVLMMLTVLFSSYSLGTEIATGQLFGGFITQGGIILGCFSLVFVLANSFLFREAIYLHHLRDKIHGNEDVRKLEKKRMEHITRWTAAQQTAKDESIAIGKTIELLAGYTKSGSARIQGQKQISMASIRRGFKDTMLHAVATHREIVLLFADQLFKTRGNETK